MNEYRLVKVKDELGYFHGWEIVNHSDQITQFYGIVEFENRIEKIDPKMISFIGDTNADDTAGYVIFK